MIDISKEQYRLLKKIKKSKRIPTSTLTDSELEICKYLMHNNCIEAALFSHQDITGAYHTLKKLPKEIALTQAGESQIYAFRSTFYRWWIPVIISAIALIVSISVPIAQVLML